MRLILTAHLSSDYLHLEWLLYWAVQFRAPSTTADRTRKSQGIIHTHPPQPHTHTMPRHASKLTQCPSLCLEFYPTTTKGTPPPTCPSPVKSPTAVCGVGLLPLSFMTPHHPYLYCALLLWMDCVLFPLISDNLLDSQDLAHNRSPK